MLSSWKIKILFKIFPVTRKSWILKYSNDIQRWVSSRVSQHSYLHNGKTKRFIKPLLTSWIKMIICLHFSNIMSEYTSNNNDLSWGTNINTSTAFQLNAWCNGRPVTGIRCILALTEWRASFGSVVYFWSRILSGKISCCIFTTKAGHKSDNGAL